MQWLHFIMKNSQRSMPFHIIVTYIGNITTIELPRNIAQFYSILFFIKRNKCRWYEDHIFILEK